MKRTPSLMYFWIVLLVGGAAAYTFERFGGSIERATGTVGKLISIPGRFVLWFVVLAPLLCCLMLLDRGRDDRQWASFGRVSMVVMAALYVWFLLQLSGAGAS
jgi:hypothetical protein